MSALGTLLSDAEAEAESAGDLAQLDAVRVKYLGKKGVLTDRLKELGRLPPEQRPAAGKEINRAKAVEPEVLDAAKKQQDDIDAQASGG